ncbi:hypothetical protein EU348_00235 [Chryseobacterium indologenes]|uniref:Uncharacterized protein n=1 Tax=Chryseobacterium indologenes TaxID=253 RepID=A0A411DH50_CHRID|nr:hypothetical protein EU348_00235 [Chryseobacterium indologenes]
MNEELKFNPVDQFPTQVEGEQFSRTVLLYDKDLDNFDLGYYDFELQKWQAMGGFQMDVICWSYIPTPNELQVSGFDSVTID